MTGDERSLLEMDGISMAYRGHDTKSPVVVLSGFALRLGARQLVAVAGRSGSGKSTVLRIAAGLQAPSSGMVRWDGIDIGSWTTDQLASWRGRFLGFVYQGAALIETLTAAENVALPAIAKGTDGRAKALDLLDQMGLPNRARHFPGQLSGGEQQRVAIARALFADPPLLMLDEPTANLDRASADSIIRLCEELRLAGKSLLVASHDPHLVAASTTVVNLEPM